MFSHVSHRIRTLILIVLTKNNETVSRCRGLFCYYDYLLFFSDRSIEPPKAAWNVFELDIDVHLMLNSDSTPSNRRARIIYRNMHRAVSPLVEWIFSPNRAIHESRNEDKNVGRGKSDAYQTPIVCIHAEHHIQKAPIFHARARVPVISISISCAFYTSCSYPHPFS